MKTYARFAASPIGAGLTVLNGGLLLTTTEAGTNVHRTARGDIGRSSGVAGFELAAWGDAAMSGFIGVIQQGASLSTYPGGDAAGVGWHLAMGRIYHGGAVVASGLPAIGNQEIVGVQVDFTAGKLRFYRGPDLVHERNLPAGGVTWYPAACVASPNPGELVAAINAGQWPNATPAGQWTPTPPASLVLRLADLNFLTAATDTPAHTRYESMITPGGFDLQRAISFWPWGEDRPLSSSATVLVSDPDGRLDALTQGDVEGVPVTIYQGHNDDTLANAAVHSRWVLVSVVVESDLYKRINLRDAHDDLAEPLNPSMFLPNIAQLAWQGQPALIGAVANAPLLPVNADASVMWLADAPVQAVAAVRDRGDLMEAGTWTLASDKQQLRMQSPMLGPATCDASSIGQAGGELAPATAQQALRELFRRIGKSNWQASDLAALDAATGYAGVGFHATEMRSAGEAVDMVLASYGAWRWDDAGVFRVARVIAPESVADADLAFELDDGDFDGDLIRVIDRAPNLTRRMGYRPNGFIYNAADLVTDLVDVPPALRVQLTSSHMGTVYSAVPLAYPYADRAERAAPIGSLFWRQQDAQAEIDRVCALYGIVRYVYEGTVRKPGLAPPPGAVGLVRYRRHGLAAGKKLLVKASQPNPVTGIVRLRLWGA